mmetsp:Transcript_86835/g.250553  ORF Transcript_86835/g.250553 Transcript_86835/m.250553 type:complete len:218 (-) Transcript_86835:127-780(-)
MAASSSSATSGWARHTPTPRECSYTASRPFWSAWPEAKSVFTRTGGSKWCTSTTRLSRGRIGRRCCRTAFSGWTTPACPSAFTRAGLRPPRTTASYRDPARTTGCSARCGPSPPTWSAPACFSSWPRAPGTAIAKAACATSPRGGDEAGAAWRHFAHCWPGGGCDSSIASAPMRAPSSRAPQTPSTAARATASSHAAPAGTCRTGILCRATSPRSVG